MLWRYVQIHQGVHLRQCRITDGRSAVCAHAWGLLVGGNLGVTLALEQEHESRPLLQLVVLDGQGILPYLPAQTCL